MSEHGRGDRQPDWPSDPWRRDDNSYRDDPPTVSAAAGPRRAANGSSGLVITLATVLVLVLCGGGALALYLMHSKNSASDARSTQAGTASGAPGARASATPSYDASGIVKGQCVANDGTEDAPKLRVVTCSPGSFLVLARLVGTADTNRCTMVPGSTHDFFYQTTQSTRDFVLCLKKQ
ncbi:hypothetical protein Raf01_13380 [Rugosimonospora africana]|uniref:Uncharacterized protein n=2 Tax=Rugosimonospora africana TaxID=556532 RepID=A0A8J3VPA2_9ACTN|nr:hypothetical protein Raf01_13380 [Rugosimonospora africana]